MIQFSLKPWVLGVLSVLFFFNPVHAQSPEYFTLYDSLSVVTPTGRLAERAPLSHWISETYANPLLRDGIGDSACSPQTFAHILDYLNEMSYNPASVSIHRDSLSSFYNTAAYGTALNPSTPQLLTEVPKLADVVLGFVDVNYNAIAPAAWDSGWVYLSAQDSLYHYLEAGETVSHLLNTDTLNTPPHPDSVFVFNYTPIGSGASRLAQTFDEGNYFALANFDPLIYVSSLYDPIRVTLPSDLFWSTHSERSYQIDLDDGNGFTSIIPGVPMDIYYTTEGDKQVRIRAVGTGGEPLAEAITHLRVVEIPANLSWSPIPFGGETSWCNALPGEVPGSGLATHVNSRGDTQMLKPFLIVEGFDRGASSETSPLLSPVFDVVGPYGFGNFNVASFVTGEYVDRTIHLGLSRVFVDSLLSRGYDIVFVDFYSNGGTIQSNAKALIQLIGKIHNRMDASGSSSDIASIGVSMGGLVLRSALREIELTGCCHRVGLYGSLSSPHKGAHIPLSLQIFLEEAANGGIDLPPTFRRAPAQLLDNVLRCPVAQQMLIQQAESSNQAVHFEFQGYLDSIGLPEQTFNIGMTNGNIHGEALKFQGQYMQPGDTLFSLGARISIPEEVPIPGHSTLSYISDLLNGFQVAPYYNFPILEAFGRATDASTSSVATQQTPLSSYGSRLLAYPTALALSTYAGIGHLSYSVSPPLVRNVLRLIHNSVLSGMHILYNQEYTASEQHRDVAFPTFGLDFCPGDLGSIDQLESLTDGLVVCRFPTHSFVPTVSALNSDASHFSDLSTLISDPSPDGFDAYWYPGIGGENYSRTEVHAQLSDSLIFWIMNTLQTLRNGPGVVSGIYSGTLANRYNFAKPENLYATSPNAIGSLDIINGGLMAVNHLGPINGGSLYNAALGSNHTLYTSVSPCDSVILRVYSGGGIQVGDSFGINSGDLKIMRTGKLEIRSGGGLRVFANSRVIVDANATLILHPGAQIELLDSTSQLVIRGGIHLKEGAVFTFSGKGEVVYETPTHILKQNRFIFEDSSKIAFAGSGPDDPVLVINSNAWEVPNRTSLQDEFLGLSIDNGQISLGNGVQMVHEAPISIQYGTVTNPGTGMHSGIHLAGQSGVSFNHTTFSNGSVGLFNLQTAFGNPMAITSCVFTDNEIGLETQGELSRIDSCIFVNNSTFGWKATDQDGLSQVDESSFTNNGTGVSFYGQLGSKLLITDSQFDLNGTGVMASESALEMICNSLSNQSSEAIYLHLSDLDISQQASNYFSSNSLDIYLENARSISITGGWNQFVHPSFPMDYYAIYGTFDPLFQGLNYHPQGWNLLATGNTFPSTSQGLTPVNMVILNDSNTIPVGLMTGPAPASMTLCRSSQQIGFDPNSLPQIPGGSEFGNKTWNQAVADGIALIARSEEGGNVDSALAILGQVLSQVPANTVQAEFQRETYEAMSKAYGLAIEWGDVERNRAQDAETMNPHLSELNSFIADKLQSLNGSDNLASDKAYAYKMDRAQLFRMSEHYDYAKTVLNNAHTWSSGDAFMRSQYWECVCDAEERLLKEDLDIESFRVEMEQCKLLMPANKRERNLPLAEYTPDLSDRLEVRISPNPSGSQAYLKIISPSCGSAAQVRVVDAKGHEIIPAFPVDPTSVVLLPNYMEPGLFFIQVESCGKSETARWVVTR